MPYTKTTTPSPPQATSATGHPLPRRSSPEHSVTLKHHRLARDASLRASAGSAPAGNTNTTSSPRRNSSGESHNTSQSDPKKWFDHSNENPAANYDSNAMDVDPPFFQRQSDSSGEEKPYSLPHQPIPQGLAADSSSNDDYRSVIDDLTVEIQKLKEELKRYKQRGPDMLRKDKLFEIKIHDLSKRKRRELESTLRDFASSLDGSPDPSSSRQKGTRTSRVRMYSGSGSMSKHASSSSGSNARPADSAYASMSTTGVNSSGPSVGRPSMTSRAKSSEQKVENYLRDIPEGLYPRHMVMSDKEKKKLVVRRLEQLFTGKISGRHSRRNRPQLPPAGVPDGQQVTTHVPPSNLQQLTAVTSIEAAREARMLPPDQQAKQGQKSRSRDNASASNSNIDQTESGNNGNSASGGGDKGSSGTNTSPLVPLPPEQRPTRPKDLDPDRVQVPSENMDYIKHLGLVPPALLTESMEEDIHPDADGWVYLNLLCNLAQLHIINVTPDFVRAAVSGMSTKFQLSRDGRKIRWRGGSEGTRFNSDSSGNNSQRSPAETEDTENSNENKRRKTGHSTGDDLQSGSSSKDASKAGQHVSTSSDSFHYKPLFVHQESNEQSSLDDTQSSFGPVDDSAIGDSRWGQSGSGTSNRRKRRHDGAIIYYSGAPFCTDLSGDTGSSSPTTCMLSSNQTQNESQDSRPAPRRSASGSSLGYRPLSDRRLDYGSEAKMDVDGEQLPDLTTDSGDDSTDFELDLPWSTEPQFLDVHHLEPCGLGGILPEDHFMVVVTTKRPKEESVGPSAATGQKSMAEETTDNIITRLASMSTSSPAPLALPCRPASPAVEIQYVSGRIKRLAPASLPPPAIFVPPFGTDDSSSLDETSYGSEDPDEENSETCSNEVVSRKANRHQSNDYPDGVELTSGDEDGEEPENEPDTLQMYERDVVSGHLRRNGSVGVNARTGGGSSVATAGGVPSDISSEENMRSMRS
ncbi:hypothetical protein N3K66_003128 [Trichothecium roseum]|uniref:Uncharacterized protein n=1 Tax=Trichothecium roseum TaxID=47278 RepID=A0ACC0V5W1_9HYPO|nr:hypothetical protein N3K66_003128 [Trichothecium roseum]